MSDTPRTKVEKYWSHLPPLFTSQHVVLASDYDALESERAAVAAELAEANRKHAAISEWMTVDCRTQYERNATLTAERNDEIEKSLDLSMQCERLTDERDALRVELTQAKSDAELWASMIEPKNDTGEKLVEATKRIIQLEQENSRIRGCGGKAF